MSVPVRVVVAALVGGIVMFVWGAVAHMMTPLGEMGISTISESEEKVFQGSLKQAFGREGLYFLPAAPMREEMSAEAMEAWAKANANEPTAFVVFQPQMGEMMPPSMLVNEAVSNIAAAFLAAVVLALSATNFAGRLAICVVIGVIGWVSISASYWTWYHFPTDFSLAELAMQAIGWFASGIPMAMLVKGRVAAGAAA